MIRHDDDAALLLAGLMQAAQDGNPDACRTARSVLAVAPPPAFPLPLDGIAEAVEKLARADEPPSYQAVNRVLIAGRDVRVIRALVDLVDALAPVGDLHEHARVLRAAYALKQINVAAMRAQQECEQPDPNPQEIGALLMGEVEMALDAVNAADTPEQGLTVTDLEGLTFHRDDLVPDFLARREVLMVTGFEGGGKSWLLAQFAVACAAGLNPLWFDPLARPLKVLLLDYENGSQVAQERLTRLARAAAAQGVPRHVVDAHLRYRDLARAGIDLADRRHEARFLAEIAHMRPDIVIAGPVYKMLAKDPKDDELARALTRVVETAQAQTGCAFILENHVPKQQSVMQDRGLAPVGSSVLMRWPQHGIGLRPQKVGTDDFSWMKVERWRGSRREVIWPPVLRAQFNEGWAWVPETLGNLDAVRKGWTE